MTNFEAGSTARYFRVKRKVVHKFVSLAINDVLVCLPVFTVPVRGPFLSQHFLWQHSRMSCGSGRWCSCDSWSRDLGRWCHGCIGGVVDGSPQDLSLKCSAWKGFTPNPQWKSPSPKQIMGLKKLLGQKKIWFWRNFGSKNCASTNFLAKINFGSEKKFDKEFWSKKNLGLKIIFEKKIWSEMMLVFEKILGLRKFCVQKKF